MEGVLLRGRIVFRDVAQPGSALAWGARGRGFKSRRPDEKQRKGKPSGLPFRVSRRVTGIVRRKIPVRVPVFGVHRQIRPLASVQGCLGGGRKGTAF